MRVHRYSNAQELVCGHSKNPPNHLGVIPAKAGIHLYQLDWLLFPEYSLAVGESFSSSNTKYYGIIA
jgi:hypothetical protein